MGKLLTSFRSKVIGITLLMVLGAQVATVIAVLAASARDANERAYRQMDSGIGTFRSVIANRARILDQTVRPLAADSSFTKAIVNRNRDVITQELSRRLEWVKADFAAVLTLDGQVLTTTGHDLPADISLSRLTTKSRSSITFDNNTFEMMTVPVEVQETIAWISMGFIVDDALARELAAITGLEMTFLTGMDSGQIRFLGSSLPRADRDLILNASLQIANGGELYKAVEQLKSRYISNREYFFPEGDEIFVVVQKPLVEAMAAYESMRGSLMYATTTTIACVLLIAIILARSVTRPVHSLLLAARRIGNGNYSQSVQIKSKDEIGELAHAFDSMREGIAKREQHIVYQARYDALTGLPNRQHGTDLLRETLRNNIAADRKVAIFVMHLQRFREIQSSLGHEIGDEVLRQTAIRLQTSLPEDTMLARLEGDQFLLIAPAMERPLAKKLAAELSTLLDTGLSVQSVNVTLDACIGLCIAPDHGRHPDELLRRAAVAKNDAQNSPNRIRFYQNGREARHVRQLAILGDLRRATKENELELFLQPKISLHDTKVCGAEALLRWSHDELGEISPNEFIPLAEQAGSISMITEWVLRRTIQQCRVWQDCSVHLPIAVNLSGRDLMDFTLPEFIAKTLEEHSVSANSLILEITEESIVQDVERATKVLRKLKSMGCRTSMDDFGTGYSSLGHLQKLPVDELKIDRAFVTQLPDDPQNVAIVRSVIELAHNLGLEVVAEGVETTAALRWLREEGCERAQGFYLSKPMPAHLFVKWLKRWESLAHEDSNIETTDSLILRPRLIS